MRVGVVVGLAAEARIARPLGWRVAIGGGTASGALTAAQGLIDEGSDALVSFGLAGGLDPALRPGALIVPCAVIVDEVRFPTDPGLSRMLGGVTPHTVVGADAIAVGVEDKRRLHCRTSAAAVDLESGSVARIADSARHAIRRAARNLRSGRTQPCLRWRWPHSTRAASSACGASSPHLPHGLAQLPALLALAVDAAAARRSLVERVRQITPTWV